MWWCPLCCHHLLWGIVYMGKGEIWPARSWRLRGSI
ncbi:hypothetical protein E2C01_066777 [Portunus trituberculatus]|uniref:Uncharacterized protein n=1 Tax=Portunus trituberculatus TaxID=210409 RepID=A0A5B7HRT4_PORTR|nr:hypothetical protein [Portunus trituberculatus]